MAVPPRSPVLVGAGPVEQSRSTVVSPPSSPPTSWPRPSRLGRRRQRRRPASLPASADAVPRSCRPFPPRYRNAARLVAERIGARPRDEAVSPGGRHESQALVSQAVPRHRRGRRRHGGDLRRRGVAHPPSASAPPDEAGLDDPGRRRCRRRGSPAPETDLNHPAEIARGLFPPGEVYPLFEQALRSTGPAASIDEHLVHVSELGRVRRGGGRQPPRLDPRARTAEEIRKPSAAQPRGLPYTKVMNANNAVEQAASSCPSVERARAWGCPGPLGVPVGRDRAHDT